VSRGDLDPFLFEKNGSDLTIESVVFDEENVFSFERSKGDLQGFLLTQLVLTGFLNRQKHDEFASFIHLTRDADGAAQKRNDPLNDGEA
jgi:hypothetical protein